LILYSERRAVGKKVFIVVAICIFVGKERMMYSRQQ
jgi:hypothetical protein